MGLSYQDEIPSLASANLVSIIKIFPYYTVAIIILMFLQQGGNPDPPVDFIPEPEPQPRVTVVCTCYFFKYPII